MQSPIPDLKNLTQFYFGLHKDLSDALKKDNNGNERSLTESILENKTRIAQIERMNVHVHQLSDNLKKSRGKLDPETGAAADALVTEAKN